jgi:hypothetical protein
VQGKRDRWSGWSPDWGEWVDSPIPLHGHTLGCVCCGECLFESFFIGSDSWWGARSSTTWSHSWVGRVTVVVPVRWQETLEWVFLTALTWGLVFVPDMNPLWGPHSRWGLLRGSVPGTPFYHCIPETRNLSRFLVSGIHVRCRSFDTWRPLPHTEDNGRPETLRWVGTESYTHVVYVTSYFCFMFRL